MIKGIKLRKSAAVLLAKKRSKVTGKKQASCVLRCVKLGDAFKQKKLSLLILFASFLMAFSLYKVIALQTIAIAIVVALKGDSDKITVTFR